MTKWGLSEAFEVDLTVQELMVDLWKRTTKLNHQIKERIFYSCFLLLIGEKNKWSDIAKNHQTRNQDQNSNPGSASNSMYDIRNVTLPLLALVSTWVQ